MTCQIHINELLHTMRWGLEYRKVVADTGVIDQDGRALQLGPYLDCCCIDRVGIGNIAFDIQSDDCMLGRLTLALTIFKSRWQFSHVQRNDFDPPPRQSLCNLLTDTRARAGHDRDFVGPFPSMRIPEWTPIVVGNLAQLGTGIADDAEAEKPFGGCHQDGRCDAEGKPLDDAKHLLLH